MEGKKEDEKKKNKYLEAEVEKGKRRNGRNCEINHIQFKTQVDIIIVRYWHKSKLKIIINIEMLEVIGNLREILLSLF